MSEIKKETTQDSVRQLAPYKTGKLAELRAAVAAQKAKVNVVMFGRNTDVEVEYTQLQKLDLAQQESQSEE